MSFDPQRLAALPIRPEYKKRIMQICSNPETTQQCEILKQTPDAKLVELFRNIEQKMGQVAQNGLPPEMVEAGQQVAPEFTQGMTQQLNNIRQPQQNSGPQEGGIASLGGASQQSIPSGVAPSDLSKVPMPMDVPRR